MAQVLWTWGDDCFRLRGQADRSGSHPHRIETPSLKTWATRPAQRTLLNFCSETTLALPPGPFKPHNCSTWGRIPAGSRGSGATLIERHRP